MKKIPLAEIAIATAVGFGLAQATKRVKFLDDNKMLTRTLLYTLGYYLATQRPEGGYKMLEQK